MIFKFLLLKNTLFIHLSIFLDSRSIVGIDVVKIWPINWSMNGGSMNGRSTNELVDEWGVDEWAVDEWAVDEWGVDER
jgi:hypothetical protein